MAKGKYPDLLLGTAMWGWTLEPTTCFAILDHFYEAGFRQVDSATNYPINKNAADFRKTNEILDTWIKAHQVHDLKVTMKIGSVNNMGTPDHNLTKSFIIINIDDYLQQFGSNLDTIMIHWDNRHLVGAIDATIDGLTVARERGLRVGLSGIRHPEIYYEINHGYQLNFRIQIKHNLFRSDYEKYRSFHGHKRFITYGINGGGVKLDVPTSLDSQTIQARGIDPAVYKEKLKALKKVIKKKPWKGQIQSMNQCGMIHAYHHPDIEGILIGPSSPEQLRESMLFYHQLHSGTFQEFYEQLQMIAQEA